MTSKPSIFALVLFCVASVAFAAASDKNEDAPIVERRMDYFDFTLDTTDGKPLNLRDYASSKRVVIISYVAGWCENSVRNGHVLKRLYDKFRDKGLGVVAVAEYSNTEEMRVFFNRTGIEYPIAIDTTKRDARKKSAHYKLRQSVGDKRRWGTPFYVIIDARNIEPAQSGGLLARRVYTVSGEIIETEAEEFLRKHLSYDLR